MKKQVRVPRLQRQQYEASGEISLPAVGLKRGRPGVSTHPSPLCLGCEPRSGVNFIRNQELQALGDGKENGPWGGYLPASSQVRKDESKVRDGPHLEMQLPPRHMCGVFKAQSVSHKNFQDVCSITRVSHKILGPLIQSQTQTLLYALVGQVVSG